MARKYQAKVIRTGQLTRSLSMERTGHRSIMAKEAIGRQRSADLSNGSRRLANPTGMPAAGYHLVHTPSGGNEMRGMRGDISKNKSMHRLGRSKEQVAGRFSGMVNQAGFNQYLRHLFLTTHEFY
jgi:hypothetical protein